MICYYRLYSLSNRLNQYLAVLGFFKCQVTEKGREMDAGQCIPLMTDILL